MWISRHAYNELLTRISKLETKTEPTSGAPEKMGHREAILAVMKIGEEYTAKKLSRAVNAYGLSKRRLSLAVTYPYLSTLTAEKKIRKVGCGIYTINKSK